MKTIVLATGLLLAATGAMAAPPAEPAASAEQQAAASPSAATNVAEASADDGKKVCRTERATGSLTRRTRICMTAAQWRELHDRTRRGVTEMQGSASGSQAVVNNPGAGG